MKIEEIFTLLTKEQNLTSSGKKFPYRFSLLAHKHGYTPKQCIDFLNKEVPLNTLVIDDFEYQFKKIEQKLESQKLNRKLRRYIGGSINERIPEFERYLLEHYDIYYDEILDEVFIRKKGEPIYTRLNDRFLHSIWLHFNRLSESFTSLSVIEQLLKTSIIKSDSGINQFLRQLPEYDGKDYISQIANTVQTTNQEMFLDRFKRWFVALVACVIVPDVVNDLSLVLVGGQGIGKTRFFKRLMPDLLSMYFVSKLPKLRDKDTEIMMAENILFVIDEIDALNFKENTALKELTTTQKVKVRKPYDKKQEEYKRYATFAGTTNRKQFLTDNTGSRRYLCFEVLEINQDKVLPIKEAFAQAKAEIDSGFQYWLDMDDIKVQEELNEEFRYREAEEELLLNYTRKPATDDDKIDIKCEQTTILLQQLQQMAQMPKAVSNASVRKLGAALAKHGYPRKSKSGRKVWEFVFLNQDDELDEMET